MITLRSIKPKGLVEAYKRLPGAVRKGMMEAAEEVKKDFERTTSTWKHQPTFTITPNGDTDFTVGTNDEIYGFVDEGTRPHVIVARGRALRFGSGGAAKTQPGRITSGAGSKGGAVVFRKMVNHPGTKARLFSKTIAEKWKRGVQPFIRAAIEEVLP